jgi:hypothetical protein
MYVCISVYALLWQACLPVAGWAPTDLQMAQTRRLIRSRMRTTLPGYSSCHQVQAGLLMDGYIKHLMSYQASIWAARFANTSSICSDSGTTHTRRISCLRNLCRVSSYFSAGYERLHWLLDFRTIHSVQVRVSHRPGIRFKSTCKC